MPRKPTPIYSNLPFHLTARTVNREDFHVSLEEVWFVMENYLYLVSKMYGLSIHSFVLMPNHFHLLATAPEQNISEIMNYFMRETSKELQRSAGRMNQTYGGRHYKSVITSYHYFLNAYKYVYRNPVRARLVEKVEDYRFSTLRGLLGVERLNIPLAEDTILFPEFFDAGSLQWLNEIPEADREIEVGKALRKPEFKFGRLHGRPSKLETELL